MGHAPPGVLLTASPIPPNRSSASTQGHNRPGNQYLRTYVVKVADQHKLRAHCNAHYNSAMTCTIFLCSCSGCAAAGAQVWEYEGAQTLGSFLRRRDCVRALALDLGVAEADAVPAVMRQLLQCLHVRRSPLLPPLPQRQLRPWPRREATRDGVTDGRLGVPCSGGSRDSAL